MWDWLLEKLDECKQWFWDIVDYCIGMVWDFCFYLYDLFLGEEGFVWWVVELFIDFALWQFDMICEAFPNFEDGLKGYEDTFGYAMRLTGMLNDFLPVAESFVLMGVFLGFMLVVLACRLILKLVPGFGG